MTNFEKIKNAFDELEIGYTIEEKENGKRIVLTANKDKNVEGYGGFKTYFSFTNEGKSTGVEIWE